MSVTLSTMHLGFVPSKKIKQYLMQKTQFAVDDAVQARLEKSYYDKYKVSHTISIQHNNNKFPSY